MGGQGSPPGRNPTERDAERPRRRRRRRARRLSGRLRKCHSVTGDLKGIGVEVPDPRALQNAWVAGSRRPVAAGAEADGGGGGAGNPATVTMADGSKLEGHAGASRTTFSSS